MMIGLELMLKGKGRGLKDLKKGGWLPKQLQQPTSHSS